MSARHFPLPLLVLVLGAAPSCIKPEEAKHDLCLEEPAKCFSPIFMSFTPEPVPGEDAVTFYVAARDPSKARQLTFKWSAENDLGLFEPSKNSASTSKVVWHNPPCMPQAHDGSHGVVITVRATNPQGYFTTKNFKFEVPLVCPEWTRATVGLIDYASHTATRLKSGSVLVAGGANKHGSVKTAALYGPVLSQASLPSSWDWEQANPMNFPRSYHAAALMDSGKVLITGGYLDVQRDDGSSEDKPLASVEVYDPDPLIEQHWSTTQPMHVARAKHTSTLLLSGNVLVAGGSLSKDDPASSSSEEYSPVDGSWSPVSEMFSARAGHTATLLPTGQVLVTGGFAPAASKTRWAQMGGAAANVAFDTVEMYEPQTKQWRLLGSRLHEARYSHTATILPSGKVLITGGFNETGPLASSEIFDPATEQWAPAGALLTARGQHTAVLLSTGEVLVAAGQGADGPLGSTEFFSANTLKWSPGSPLQDPRTEHSATLLFSEAVLITGGINSTGTYGTSTELYTPTELAPRGKSIWLPAGDLITAEAGHTATKLPSGEVLVAGGYGFAPGYPGAVLYNPNTKTWRSTSSMVSNREDHTATLLPSGKVLMAGGDGLGLSELYDAATDSWAATGNLMGSARKLHTATLLPSGKVLVAGGDLSLMALASAELYDPATGLWSPTGDMLTARERHTATLLPSGKVLVTGGAATDQGAALDSAEIYDPDTGTWTATANMPSAALLHRATLLAASGKVLITGGTSGNISSPPGKSAVLYDPATETWIPVADMNQARNLPTATLLPSGKVLVTGGDLDSQLASTAEIYDPATGIWSATEPLSARRFNHTATLLSSGDVLITGGFDFSPLVSAFLASTEVYLPQRDALPAP